MRKLVILKINSWWSVWCLYSLVLDLGIKRPQVCDQPLPQRRLYLSMVWWRWMTSVVEDQLRVIYRCFWNPQICNQTNINERSSTKNLLKYVNLTKNFLSIIVMERSEFNLRQEDADKMKYHMFDWHSIDGARIFNSYTTPNLWLIFLFGYTSELICILSSNITVSQLIAWLEWSLVEFSVFCTETEHL